MSEKPFCTIGPYELEMKVGITNGEQTGTITVGLGHGEVPTEEKIREQIAKAEEAAKANGFRLMNRHEYLQEQILGSVGERVAIPGPKEFSRPDKITPPQT